MITLLLSNWRIVSIGALCGAVALFFTLWRHEVSVYAEFRAVAAAHGKAAEEHAKSVEYQQKQITQETADAWSKNLDYVRRYYSERLRNSGGGAMPGISNPARSIDAIPADALPIAGECAETTAQLIGLQGWVREQQAVK